MQRLKHLNDIQRGRLEELSKTSEIKRSGTTQLKLNRQYYMLVHVFIRKTGHSAVQRISEHRRKNAKHLGQSMVKKDEPVLLREEIGHWEVDLVLDSKGMDLLT